MLPSKVIFSKLNSAGNDFICINNTTGVYADLLASQESAGAFARLLCRRGLSVGADGLIVANQIDDGDANTIVARFLEPDGSETRLCGNGTACFTYWAITNSLVPGSEVQVITRAGTADGRLTDDRKPTRVRVCIPDPTEIIYDLRITTENRIWRLAKVDIGVPHAIVYVDNLDELNVDHWGCLIRHHPSFAPGGINANFVQILGPGHLAIRTFEFGVESETLACGTGSAAAAIISCLKEKWGEPFHDCQRPVAVTTRSGDTLHIWFKIEADGGAIGDVCMESTVRPVYDATIHPELYRQLMQAIQPGGAK